MDNKTGNNVQEHAKLKELLVAARTKWFNEFQSEKKAIRTEGAGRPQQNMDQIESDDLDLHALMANIRSSTVREIEEAILRIEQGIYGKCTMCRRNISKIRLEARPFSVVCKSCQDKAEEKEKREASHSDARDEVREVVFDD